MPRKTYRIPGHVIEFPVEHLWENERHSWEDHFGDDPLGNDLEGRLWAVRHAIKTGAASADADVTLIEKSQLGALIEPLGLDGPNDLVIQLWEIAGRHLRPKHMEILGSGPRTIAKQLNVLGSNLDGLEKSLGALPIVARNFLTENFHRIPQPARNGERLDINALEQALSDLRLIVGGVADVLDVNTRRPANPLRRQTMRNAATAIEAATGNRVLTQWSENDQRCFKFKGKEGAVLLAFMQLLEPKTRESALVREFRGLGFAKAAPPKN